MSIRNATLGVVFLAALVSPAFAEDKPADEAAPAEPAPAARPLPPAPASSRAEEGRIVLRATADSWVKVQDGQDGAVLVNRVFRPGESWAAPAREGLRLSTGNALGLEILVDGQVVPGLGPGRAVRRDVPMEPERLKSGLPPPGAAASAPQ